MTRSRSRLAAGDTKNSNKRPVVTLYGYAGAGSQAIICSHNRNRAESIVVAQVWDHQDWQRQRARFAGGEEARHSNFEEKTGKTDGVACSGTAEDESMLRALVPT